MYKISSKNIIQSIPEKEHFFALESFKPSKSTFNSRDKMRKQVKFSAIAIQPRNPDTAYRIYRTLSDNPSNMQFVILNLF
jgi:hypothetical protein